MTLYEEWINGNCSVLNIERKLNKMIHNQRWTNLFCRDSKDRLIPYTQSNRQMKRELKANCFRYVSSIFNEELALRLIRKAVGVNLSEIATWLRGEETSLNLLISSEDEPVGIVMRGENFVQDFSFNAMIILKKADKPCENRSEFYVEKIAPVPGFTDLG